eukprot:scaffold149621_cov23-Tisochrysis_lutea.AAC.2
MYLMLVCVGTSIPGCEAWSLSPEARASPKCVSGGIPAKARASDWALAEAAASHSCTTCTEIHGQSKGNSATKHAPQTGLWQQQKSHRTAAPPKKDTKVQQRRISQSMFVELKFGNAQLPQPQKKAKGNFLTACCSSHQSNREVVHWEVRHQLKKQPAQSKLTARGARQLQNAFPFPHHDLTMLHSAGTQLDVHGSIGTHTQCVSGQLLQYLFDTSTPADVAPQHRCSSRGP